MRLDHEFSASSPLLMLLLLTGKLFPLLILCPFCLILQAQFKKYQVKEIRLYPVGIGERRVFKNHEFGLHPDEYNKKT